MSAKAENRELKTTLVTGGAGFVGSHLCRSLLKQGYRVLCVDNFATGKAENIADLRANKDFVMITHDIRQPLSVSEPVHFVFHLASRASPEDYQRHAVETLETNALGTLHLLRFANQHHARFLISSTSEVYGDPLVHPQPESYWGNVNPIGIRSCYDEGKRFAEALVMAFHRETGLDVRIARIFNTYGPGMASGDGRVVPNFIVQAIRNEPLTVYGDGSQTRSLCYVFDLVAGLEKLMFTDGLAGEVVNLGATNEVTVLELAERVKRIAKSTSTISHKPLPMDDPTRRRPDITKAKKLLGWEPRTELDQGIAATVAHFRERLKASAAR